MWIYKMSWATCLLLHVLWYFHWELWSMIFIQCMTMSIMIIIWCEFVTWLLHIHIMRCRSDHIAIILRVDSSLMWYLVLYKFINFPGNLLLSYMSYSIDTLIMNDENNAFIQSMWCLYHDVQMIMRSCHVHTKWLCIMECNPFQCSCDDAIFVMNFYSTMIHIIISMLIGYMDACVIMHTSSNIMQHNDVSYCAHYDVQLSFKWSIFTMWQLSWYY
jgi:hypothetical protein